jgi:AcrR family transcriptional regulator
MASPRRLTAGQQETRALLVEHAVGLVEEVGLARFTAREVARRAGVSHAAPFRHFPSRSALLADAAASGFRDLRVRMVAAAGLSATNHDLVVRLGMEYVAFALERSAIFELMFTNNLMNDADDLVLEHRLSVFNLMIDGATGGDARIATPLETSLLAGVHGLAVLASQGLVGPLTHEHLQLALERHVLAQPWEQQA